MLRCKINQFFMDEHLIKSCNKTIKVCDINHAITCANSCCKLSTCMSKDVNIVVNFYFILNFDLLTVIQWNRNTKPFNTSTWSQVFSVSDQVLHGFYNLCNGQVLQNALTHADNFTHLQKTEKKRSLSVQIFLGNQTNDVCVITKSPCYSI